MFRVCRRAFSCLVPFLLFFRRRPKSKPQSHPIPLSTFSTRVAPSSAQNSPPTPMKQDFNHPGVDAAGAQTSSRLAAAHDGATDIMLCFVLHAAVRQDPSVMERVQRRFHDGSIRAGSPQSPMCKCEKSVVLKRLQRTNGKTATQDS